MHLSRLARADMQVACVSELDGVRGHRPAAQIPGYRVQRHSPGPGRRAMAHSRSAACSTLGALGSPVWSGVTAHEWNQGREFTACLGLAMPSFVESRPGARVVDQAGQRATAGNGRGHDGRRDRGLAVHGAELHGRAAHEAGGLPHREALLGGMHGR